MELKLFQVDAFTSTVFSGNPACVVPLDSWLDDSTLLEIAKENAVAETAFFIKKKDHFHLRWFTPDIEMDLCGHATLATAHCIFKELNYKKEKVIFETMSGRLEVEKVDHYYQMVLPSRPAKKTNLPEPILNSLNVKPLEVYKSRDYLLIYEDQKAVENIIINRPIFDQININPGGVIVSAEGDQCDFVSRFFTPQATILEDPVTGSAHCTLTPYWSKKLGKTKLKAQQLSSRGGSLSCELKKDQVYVLGKAITYLKGSIVL